MSIGAYRLLNASDGRVDIREDAYLLAYTFNSSPFTTRFNDRATCHGTRAMQGQPVTFDLSDQGVNTMPRETLINSFFSE